MAGIYIHIPFCKQKCSYCDFYSNTNLGIAQVLIDAEIEEMNLRQNYLDGESVGTIYFGGGTPSLLTLSQVELLINAIYEKFDVVKECEITVECNPDDLTFDYLKHLSKLGVNRISIGVQSFDDRILKFLNRRHSSTQAEQSVKLAQAAGFSNISIDLMFGIPGMSFESYNETVLKAVTFDIQHISAYQLTFEENTVLYKKLVNHKFEEIDEEESIAQFEFTIEKLSEFGFDHYEISNYAKKGFVSKHNSLYWNNETYLGIGPSAHSYDRKTRQWNLSNINLYIKGIKLAEGFSEMEYLSENDRFNEYILTRLRTSKGLSIDYVENNFNGKIKEHFLNIVNGFVVDGFIDKVSSSFTLSKKGILILDFIVRKFYLQ